MNQPLQKLLIPALLCYLPCIATTTIHSTENQIKHIEDKCGLLANRKDLEMLSEQKDHFYAILLKKDLEYNLPYHEMSQTLKSKCVCNKEGKYHGFFDRINAKEKLDYLKDKTSKHIFSHQIPTKYIQLFYQGKEIKNNRELERILDKHRRKEVKKTKQYKKRIDKYLKIEDLTSKEGLSFTYKITYFPLLFLIYKENPA